MATACLDIPMGGCLPDVTSPAQGEVLNNTGVTMMRWLFDASTDEFIHFEFRMPGDYASGLTLKLIFAMASATSGNVIMQALVMAISPGDSAAIDTGSLATVNTSSATAVAGTAGYPKEISITLSNDDSVAAGDWVDIKIGRDADNGSDTASGDLELYAAMLEYTTT